MSFIDTIAKRLDGLGHHPDKNKINALSATAKDVLVGNVIGVNAAELISLIFKKIMRASAKNKVPLWYLVDSILYNVGGEYLKFIENNLPMVFQVRSMLLLMI